MFDLQAEAEVCYGKGINYWGVKPGQIQLA